MKKTHLTILLLYFSLISLHGQLAREIANLCTRLPPIKDIKAPAFYGSDVTPLPSGEILHLGFDDDSLYFVKLDGVDVLSTTSVPQSASKLKLLYATTATHDGALLVGGHFDDSYGLLLLDEKGNPLINHPYTISGKPVALYPLQDDRIMVIINTREGSGIKVFALERDAYEEKIKLVEAKEMAQDLRKFKEVSAHVMGPNQTIAVAGTRKGQIIFGEISYSPDTKEIDIDEVMSDQTGFESANALSYDRINKEYLLAGSTEKQRGVFFTSITPNQNRSIRAITIKEKRTVPYQVFRRASSVAILSANSRSNEHKLLEIDAENDYSLIANIEQKQKYDFEYISHNANGDYTLIGRQNGKSIQLSIDGQRRRSVPSTLTIEKAEWLETLPDDSLQATERTFFRVDLKVEANQYSPVTIRLDAPGINTLPVHFEEEILLHVLPFEGSRTVTAHLPLVGGRNLLGGRQLDFNIEVYDWRGKLLDTFKYGSIPTKAPPSPELRVLPISDSGTRLKVGNRLLASTDTLWRLDTLKASIAVRNEGDATAYNLRLSADLPYHIKWLNKLENTSLDTLSPDATHRFELEFIAPSYYSLDTLQICFFAKADADISAFNCYSLRMTDVFALRDSTNRVKLSPRIQEYRDRYGHGPSAATYVPTVNADEISIQFEIPLEGTEGTKVKNFMLNYFPFRATICSSVPLGKKDIIITYGTDRRFKYQDTLPECDRLLQVLDTLDSKLCNGSYYYRYFAYLPLMEKASNFFNIVVSDGTKTSPPKSLTVNHKDMEHHLWVYSIGVPFDGVPTAESALAFGNTFKRLQNKTENKRFYDSVHTVEIITDSILTTQAAINELFGTLRKKFNSISPDTEHTLIFYICSHGIKNTNENIPNENLYLKSSQCKNNECIYTYNPIININGLIAPMAREFHRIYKYFIIESCYSTQSIKNFKKIEKGTNEDYNTTIIAAATGKDYANDSSQLLTTYILTGKMDSILNHPEKKVRDEIDKNENGLIDAAELSIFLNTIKYEIFKQWFPKIEKDQIESHVPEIFTQESASKSINPSSYPFYERLDTDIPPPLCKKKDE